MRQFGVLISVWTGILVVGALSGGCPKGSGPNPPAPKEWHEYDQAIAGLILECEEELYATENTEPLDVLLDGQYRWNSYLRYGVLPSAFNYWGYRVNEGEWERFVGEPTSGSAFRPVELSIGDTFTWNFWGYW